jgi:O-antigen/teichoic acid export membrane protein
MNVVLNFVLIPKYGITASAVLTVITEFFIFALEWYYLKKILVNLQSKTTETA